jgi:acyl-CoA thioesterase-1
MAVFCYTRPMKKTLLALSIIIIITGGIFYMKRNTAPDITNYPGSGEGIVVFGDSLTAGYGATSGKDFVSLLEQKFAPQDIKVINQGRNGDTTTSALERLDTVIELDPKLVIVFLGGNDILRKVPAETTFANLRQIIEEVQASGAMVALVGVPGGILGDPYADRYEALATEYKTIYISQFLSSILFDSKLRYDGIHPNDAGYEIVAERIYEGVKEYIE